MPTGSEEQSIRWFKEGPILIEVYANFIMKGDKINDNGMGFIKPGTSRYL